MADSRVKQKSSDNNNDFGKKGNLKGSLSGSNAATEMVSSMDAVTTQDRVAIYLLLARLYAQTGRLPEAQILLNDAAAEFRGTSSEVQIVVAQAAHYVEKGISLN